MVVICIEASKTEGNVWRLTGSPELRLGRLKAAFANIQVRSAEARSPELACWMVSGPTLDPGKLFSMVRKLCEADELIGRVDSNPLASHGSVQTLAVLRSPEVAVAIESYLPGRIENALQLLKQADEQLNYQDRHVFRQLGNAKYDNAVTLRKIASQVKVPAVLS